VAEATKGTGAYSVENNRPFLEYRGDPAELYWFGEIVASGLLRKVAGDVPAELRRQAREGGQATGFRTSRAGLLSLDRSAAGWFATAKAASEVRSLLLEPESLVRGVLYGAAMATIVLTSGTRVTELLQISAARFVRITVGEVKDGRPTGRKRGVVCQKLLPKGCEHEAERQLFLISEQALKLLRRIGEDLEARHDGAIPVVHPRETRRKNISARSRTSSSGGPRRILASASSCPRT
jgi:hypothetical protein